MMSLLSSEVMRPQHNTKVIHANNSKDKSTINSLCFMASLMPAALSYSHYVCVTERYVNTAHDRKEMADLVAVSL